jgi:hypothetical protein
VLRLAGTTDAHYEGCKTTELTQTFDSDMAGWTDVSMAGGTVTRTTTQPRTGTHSLEFTTPVTQYTKAAVSKTFSWAAKVRCVDLWFYYAVDEQQVIEVSMEAWSGTETHLASFSIKHHPDFPEFSGFQYWSGDFSLGLNGWSRIPGTDGLTVTQGAWHHLRLKVDYLNDEYVSFELDDVVYDLRGRPLVASIPSTDPAALYVGLICWTQTGGVTKMFVDDLAVLLDGRLSVLET